MDQNSNSSLPPADNHPVAPSENAINAVGPTFINPAAVPAAAPKSRLPRIMQFKRLSSVGGLSVAAVFLAVTLSFVLYFLNHRHTSNAAIQTQAIDLSKLPTSNGSYSLGAGGQSLVVNADSTFKGSVTVQSDLNATGTTTANNLNVTGLATIQGLTVKNTLTVAGTASLQSANVSGNLTAQGNGSFGGTLSAKSLSVGSLNIAGNLGVGGDLTIGGHLIVTGGTPKIAPGSTVGGSASVKGSDTAGTLTVNPSQDVTGSAFTTLATVTFATAFSTAPTVILTPSSIDAARYFYYVNKSNTAFTVYLGAISGPPFNFLLTGNTISFDYLVIP